MSSISFTGFPLGEQVTIAATSSGESDVATVAEWGINASISVHVKRSALACAPECFTFKVTGWSEFETQAGNTAI